MFNQYSAHSLGSSESRRFNRPVKKLKILTKKSNLLRFSVIYSPMEGKIEINSVDQLNVGIFQKFFHRSVPNMIPYSVAVHHFFKYIGVLTKYFYNFKFWSKNVGNRNMCWQLHFLLRNLQ